MPGKSIPVNIITGFLGVGKTTCILGLLADRPETEKWAVLVNEFGRVPIDAAAIRALGEDGMQIAEVSGGCLCCTAGVDTRMALKGMIKETFPDRVLIEPTGLGHPDRIREAILDGIEEVRIRLATSICLVDPRQCIKPGIENILSYWEQVAMAEVIVINKVDTVNREQLTECRELLVTKFGDDVTILETQNGRIPPGLLEGKQRTVSRGNISGGHQHHEHFPHKISEPAIELSGGRAQRRESSGLEHFGCGWKFDPSIQFSLRELDAFFNGILEEDHRSKGIFNTDEGWMLFNAVGKETSWKPTESSEDSRLEYIQPTKPRDWKRYERGLLGCWRK